MCITDTSIANISFLNAYSHTQNHTFILLMMFLYIQTFY